MSSKVGQLHRDVSNLHPTRSLAVTCAGRYQLSRVRVTRKSTGRPCNINKSHTCQSPAAADHPQCICAGTHSERALGWQYSNKQAQEPAHRKRCRAHLHQPTGYVNYAVLSQIGISLQLPVIPLNVLPVSAIALQSNLATATVRSGTGTYRDYKIPARKPLSRSKQAADRCLESTRHNSLESPKGGFFFHSEQQKAREEIHRLAVPH